MGPWSRPWGIVRSPSKPQVFDSPGGMSASVDPVSMHKTLPIPVCAALLGRFGDDLCGRRTPITFRLDKQCLAAFGSAF